MDPQTRTTIAPEKAPVSQNGTAPSQPSPPSSALDKLFIANTSLTVWLIFFAIGGGILALYYARIGYLPDIEWKAVLIYLFVGSVVGGAIGLLLTMSLYLPGVIWSEFILADPSLNFSYTAPASKLPDKEPVPELCTRSIVNYLGLPFLIALLASHVALLVGKITYWVIAAGILIVTFPVIRKCLAQLLKTEKTSDEASKQLFKYSFWYTLSVLLSQISMYVIYWLSGRRAELSLVHDGPGGLHWWDWMQSELPVFIVLTLMCTAGVWISNHVVALRHRLYPRQALVAALVTAGLLLFTADHFSCLSMRLMNRYGLGDHQTVNVLLTDRGRDIARSLSVQVCGTNALCGAEVLSKVGDDYYLRVGQTYITIPKSEVISMTR
ncbi:MAG TPA: hypothetical protein VJW17_06295 [Pyrinomonadaceae bacterium]|nr:hypothetical protein [Pyrinomonadaceae bacterium]